MGLDMYLQAELRWFGGNEQPLITKVKEALPPGVSLQNLVVDVGYWRKANQIHAWFVENVQHGVDECQKDYVQRVQLVTLRGICDTVLKDRSKAAELLPTQTGFFFGSTEYDEGYFQDLIDTVAIIDLALTLSEDWDFSYQASW